MRRYGYVSLALLLLVAFLPGGCSARRDRSEKPSPDWSRGLILGKTDLKQPVALQADATGHVHLVWCDSELRYAQLDNQAHVLRNETLNVDTFQPRRPQLLTDHENQVHLAWLSRKGGIQRLYYSLIQPAQASVPLLLSREGEDVGSFQAYLDPNGEVAFLWASTRSDGSHGIVHARLSQPSALTDLVRSGSDPFAAVDTDGTVHLAWLEDVGASAHIIYYATLLESASGLQVAPAGGYKLDTFELAQGAVYYGPLIGLDTTTIYVIWSVHNLGGGLTPTAGYTYYHAFEKGSPIASRPRTITLPGEIRPEYTNRPMSYGLTRLSVDLPSQAGYGSEFVTMPATVPTQMDELPLAVSLLTESSARSQIQLAVAVLAQGNQVGYQLASARQTASLMPSLAVDRGGNLHLAWIETAGIREYDVYYATAAPAARQWLDRTTADDLTMGAADTLFGVLSGVGLLPVAGVWTFPPLVFLVLFFIFGGPEELSRKPAQVGFAVAIAIYVGMKVLLLPGLFSGTPFLHAVPQAWATAISIAIPVLILVLALGAAYLYVRRAERATIFRAFLLFALVDVALTLVLYAPGFFGRA